MYQIITNLKHISFPKKKTNVLILFVYKEYTWYRGSKDYEDGKNFGNEFTE